MESLYRRNIVLEKSMDFALEVIAFCKQLEGEGKFVIAKQLLKSGNSIGANVHEARGAESQKDLLHKVNIAYKEAEETHHWLVICQRSPTCPTREGLMTQVLELKRMLGKIRSTVRNHIIKA